MSSKPWLSIIGIDLSGWSGLSPAARAMITDADLIVGGARHLDMVPASAARRPAMEKARFPKQYRSLKRPGART